MRSFTLLPAVFLYFSLASCLKKEPGKNFRFSISENTELIFKSESAFYYEKSDSIRFKQTAEIRNILLQQSEKNGTWFYQWKLLPGWSVKELPDTVYYEINDQGVYCHYNQSLFEGAEKNFLLAPFPLTKGEQWESRFFHYPASASCGATDTLVRTRTGNFHCFRVDYHFSPDYMNGFITDSVNYKVEADLSDYFSPTGRILSRINYYLTDRKDPVKKWLLLKNETKLTHIKIKD